MQVLKFTELKDVPWKNGGGITRSIAEGLVTDQVAWTISRADVAQDGPFSDFAGMIRILTVVSGREMTLESPEGVMEATLWAPIRFDGGLSVSSRLTSGPLTDLNLMFNPMHCDGEVKVLRGPVEKNILCPVRGLIVHHVLAGTPRINAMPLTIGDTTFIDDTDQTLALSDADAILEIRLTYSDQSADIRLCIADR